MLQLPQQERSSIADDDDQPAAAFRVLIVKCDRLGADAFHPNELGYGEWARGLAESIGISAG